MDFSADLGDLPKPALIGIGTAIVVVALVGLFFLVDRFVYPILPRASEVTEQVKPPPGYPDVPPFNTKTWQARMKKQGGIPPRMGAPMGAPQ
jgi:hypothetical protein